MNGHFSPDAIVNALQALTTKTVPTACNANTTSPAVALVSVQALAANLNRKGVIIYNNSSNSVYLCFALTASSNGCHIIIPTFASWTFIPPVMYTGQISAIRNAGSGNLNIVEFY